jgi:hypothetical protein
MEMLPLFAQLSLWYCIVNIFQAPMLGSSVTAILRFLPNL